MSEAQLVHISLLRLILANLDKESESTIIYPWSNDKARQIMSDIKSSKQHSEQAQELAAMSPDEKEAYRDYLNRNSAFSNIRTAHEGS